MTLPCVLFVEPQGQVLQNLPSGINPLEDEWQSLYVKTPETALDIISQRHIRVIVANFGTDINNCTKFFQSLPSITSPTIPFVLLLKNIDDELAIDIDVIHLCISAQCEPTDIIKEIQRGLTIWDQIQDNISLAKLLTKLDKLPTPPALYFDLRDELESSNCNLETVAKIISHDQAITLRLLNVVNSGFYGVPRSIVELKQAISLIGTELVLGLVLTAYLFDSLPLPGLNLDVLWKHNLTVSALAKHIASEQGGNRTEIEASGVAGLLHDIGSLILLANLSSQYHTLIRQAAGDENKLLNLEYEHFGVAHPEIGALALRLCNLSDIIIEAVAMHHHQAGQTSLLPAKALSIAEWLVNTYTAEGGEFSENIDFSGMDNNVLIKIEDWWNQCSHIAENVKA